MLFGAFDPSRRHSEGNVDPGPKVPFFGSGLKSRKGLVVFQKGPGPLVIFLFPWRVWRESNMELWQDFTVVGKFFVFRVLFFGSVQF